MSTQPSPGPSTQPPPPQQPKQKQQKPITIGIAAGAEDAKYQAKYKDLKRKVKEIEVDNDKLTYKVLQAKRSVQRMKLERAILYERLSAPSTPPSAHDSNPYPVVRAGPGVPPNYPPATHPPPQEGYHYPDTQYEPPGNDYPRTVKYSRPPESRSVPPMPTIGPGVAPPSHIPPLHSPRRSSSGGLGHDPMRSVPHLQQLPPPGHVDEPRNHNHNHNHALPSSPVHHNNAHPARSRSHQDNGAPYHHPSHPPQYPDNFPSVPQVMHSPPLSDRERARRHEMHEMSMVHSHGPQPTLSHISPQMHPAEARSSARIHHHQRIGPGAYINREDSYERQREYDREREHEWERERERDRDHERGREPGRELGRSREIGSTLSPPSGHRSRPPPPPPPPAMERGDYADHHATSRMREDQPYYHDPPAPASYALLSRSGTPGSGSGSGTGPVEAPSRPDSRTQFYEPEHSRSYRLRPVSQLNEDIDFVREDGRSVSLDRGGSGNYPSPEQNRSSLDSRKRNRNDMDVDSENDVVDDGPTGPGAQHSYTSGRASEDRGSKRYHREHRRSVDIQEDSRMGPP